MTSALEMACLVVTCQALISQGWPFSPRLKHRENARQCWNLLWLDVRHYVRGRQQALHKPRPRNIEVTLQRDLLEVVHADLEHFR
jgi:hypothetical protein